jgi:tetratricopeptide (TPR) repeat protein
VNQALSFVRAQPVAAARLLGKKLLMMGNGYETPQIESPDLFRRIAGPLGLPLLGSFFFLGALGLVGLICAGRWAGIGQSLRLYVLLLTIGTTLFFVTDRYRIHLVPALALLAGMAIETFLVLRLSQSKQSIRRLLFAGLGAVALVTLPVSRHDRGYDEWLEARDLGARWLEKGQPQMALGEFQRAIQLEGVLGLDEDSTLSLGRAFLHFNYGVALKRAGREEEALRWLRAAAVEDPDNARFVRTLGDAYLVTGRTREGDSLLRRVNSLPGGGGEALLSQGYQAARAGHLDQAEEFFKEAIDKDARLYGAWAALIRVQVQRREDALARETVERAAQTGMSPHVLLVHQALVAAASGDSATALRALERIQISAIENDPTLVRVVAWTRQILQNDRQR